MRSLIAGGSLMLRCSLALLALGLAAGCSTQHYSLYDGPRAERVGQGGTRSTFEGVDIWTAGTPPRRFRVIGVLTDVRSTGGFAASAFEMDVAYKVREAGGDAAIVLDESTQLVGVRSAGSVSSLGSTTFGSRTTRTESDRTTHLAVVKYLEPAQTEPADAGVALAIPHWAGNWNMNAAGACTGVVHLGGSDSSVSGNWGCGGLSGGVVGAVNGESFSLLFTSAGYNPALVNGKISTSGMSGTISGSGFPNGTPFTAVR